MFSKRTAIFLLGKTMSEAVQKRHSILAFAAFKYRTRQLATCSSFLSNVTQLRFEVTFVEFDVIRRQIPSIFASFTSIQKSQKGLVNHFRSGYLLENLKETAGCGNTLYSEKMSIMLSVGNRTSFP